MANFGIARLTVGFVVSLGAGLLPATGHAFGTINTLGQSAEHEKITRLGLESFGFEPKTMSEIAGKGGSFGAVGAPDNPTRGLMGQKSAHCDGGDYLNVPNYPHSQLDAQATLTSCQAWIYGSLNTAVNAAGALLNANGTVNDSQIPTFFSCTYNGSSGRAKCNVMEALGLAFHASQDFYSHSNWTDAMPGAITVTTPPGLTNVGLAPWLDPRAAIAFPAGLISGCYDGFPEGLFCTNRVKHEYLNKDKGPIDVANHTIGQGTTPRAQGNNNFAGAVNGAIADTQNKWNYFTERVLAVYGQPRGNTIICAMLKDNPAKTCK